MADRMVTVVAPDGREKSVPAVDVKWYTDRGAKVKAGPPTPGVDIGSMAANTLPFIGGGLGGVAGLAMGGPPGAIAGAFAGGATGQTARNAIAQARGLPAPSTFLGSAKDVAGAGASQAIQELAGQGIGAGMRAGAGALMRAAIRPSPAIVREFGPVWNVALKEGVPVGKLGGKQAGSAVANALRQSSAEDLTKALADAQAKGITFTAQDLVNGVADLQREVAKQPLAAKDYLAIRKMVREFIDSRRAPRVAGKMGKMLQLTPQDVNELKQAAQKVAEPVYKAMQKGGAMPSARQAIEARFNKAIATGSRQALERAIPETAPINARTKQLIGLQQALSAAETRNPPGLGLPATMGGAAGSLIGAGLGGYHGALTGGAAGALAAPLARLAMTPEVASRLALLLNNPIMRQTLMQTPRAGGYFLYGNAEQP